MVACDAPRYLAGGVPIYSADNSGHSVAVQTNPDSDFSLPGVVTPNSNSSMQTSATYASSWAATSLLGPNGAQATTTYDYYGRPSQSTIPDGATTTYTYTYYNSVTHTGANTQTATVDGRWQTTTLDGFGRTIHVQKGNGSTVISTVDTTYAPCGCSPLGKMSAVSEPYAPGGTEVWTRYTYDASGRTIAVTAPDGASTTSYSYAGNSTTVTDAAGKWKTSITDAYGNLTQVTEPNPAGGANLQTYYTYTPLNQLATVSMTRTLANSNPATQTRTFTYSGWDMVSATNPENGTVTYTYDASHHVTSRTDATGRYTQYTYDAYERLAAVDYFPQGSGYAEDLTQKVTYTYDTCSNGVGRVCGVSFGPGVTAGDMKAAYSYAYTYNQAGRVLTQTMGVQATSSYNNQNATLLTMAAAYQWDTEGRMTSLQYPTVTAPENLSFQWQQTMTLATAAYQYDVNGRMAGMTWDSGSGPQPYASATYNQAGQLLTLSYSYITETRTYNSMMQLITQQAPGYMNMTYNYSATQNNGRITSSVDGMTAENTTYTYDSQNRLASASNSYWSQAYGYDGFGNLTSKSQANGYPNPSTAMSVVYDGNNHQIGASYDGNGNLLSANGQSNGYSMENRLNSQSASAWPYASAMYGYDPWGKRAMKRTDPDPYNLKTGSNPTWEFDFYGITGQRLVSVSCSNEVANQNTYGWAWPVCEVLGQNVYYGKKLIVSNGVAVVTDRMGSVRANYQSEQFAYYPYGEERTNTADGREKFGTYFRDAVGQDYADQRYHDSGMGRFFTVDPGGAGTPTLSSSETWNRYAFVRGDPVNRVDRHGLADCLLGGGDDSSCNGPALETGDGGLCNGLSGVYASNFGWGFVDYPDPTCESNTGPGSSPAGGDEPVSYPASFRFIGAVINQAFTSQNCPQGDYGLFVTETFQVLDQFGQPLSIGGLQTQESIPGGIQIFEPTSFLPTVSVYPGSNGWVPIGNQGQTYTNSSGQFTDSPFGGCGNGADIDLFQQQYRVSYSGVWYNLSPTINVAIFGLLPNTLSVIATASGSTLFSYTVSR